MSFSFLLAIVSTRKLTRLVHCCSWYNFELLSNLVSIDYSFCRACCPWPRDQVWFLNRENQLVCPKNLNWDMKINAERVAPHSVTERVKIIACLRFKFHKFLAHGGHDKLPRFYKDFYKYQTYSLYFPYIWTPSSNMRLFLYSTALHQKNDLKSQFRLLSSISMFIPNVGQCFFLVWIYFYIKNKPLEYSWEERFDYKELYRYQKYMR